MKFKNHYETKKIKKEFFTKISKEDMTDQSQLASASIVEMAKRYGIDAILAKAEQTQVDQNVMDKLYGHDLTKLYTDKAEMLTMRNKLNNLFENIPARLRKNMFDDKVENFIHAYTSNDENKLEALSGIGLVSKTQLENVKEYNKIKREEAKEAIKRQEFTDMLKDKGVELYEQFKKTGNIINNNIQNNTTDNKNV